MRAHTRPFVTALSRRTGSYPKLVGSGAYFWRNGQRLVLTCEHVARQPDLEHRFWNSSQWLPFREPFTLRPNPVDAAWCLVPEDTWSGITHQSDAIPYERFDVEHSIADHHELLFFRGFAGENAPYDGVELKTHGSGYCSQEKREVDFDSRIFEVFWEPDNTMISSETTPEARAEMRFNDPAGFSGSLIWNTKYRQCSLAGEEWSPSKAVVTGLVRRYDPETKTLLALRVEHLRSEIEKDA
jgi:hypothetical protein